VGLLAKIGKGLVGQNVVFEVGFKVEIGSAIGVSVKKGC
jgi:hypothetical protein